VRGELPTPETIDPPNDRPSKRPQIFLEDTAKAQMLVVLILKVITLC
jgi:hypothetical protein